jgi:hypothetical protein
MKLKHQFLEVEGNLDLQKIPKQISIPNRRALNKKAVVMKDKNEKCEKIIKNIHCVQ